MKITGVVDVVGDNSLSPNESGYDVRRVVVDRLSAPTESKDASTVPATEVLYLEVEVDSPDANSSTVFWVRSQPNVEIEPNRETCMP